MSFDPGQPGSGPQVPGGPPAPPAPPAHPVPGGATATIAPPPPTEDQEDMPLPSGRGPASTKILVVMVLIAFSFLAGAWAQKKNDEGMIRPAKGPLAAMSGAIGTAGGTGGGGGDAAAAAGAMQAAIAAGQKPVLAAAGLKGTVVAVNGSVITIRDADGIERQAQVSTLSYIGKAAPLDSMNPGDYVYVLGQKAPDGSMSGLAVVQDEPPQPGVGQQAPPAPPTAGGTP